MIDFSFNIPKKSDIVEYGLSIGETEIDMKKLINTIPLLGGYLK